MSATWIISKEKFREISRNTTSNKEIISKVKPINTKLDAS